MQLAYNPDQDIPDLNGKVFLLTGGTSGVGRETILQLAEHDAKHIYFTGRNTEAAQATIDAVKCASPTSNVTFIPCDQTSLSSVSQAAKSFLSKSEGQLDVLICNAGVMAVPQDVSKDNYEIHFAINFLAHALLIKLCLPALQQSVASKGEARVILLSSQSFRRTPQGGIVFKDLKSSQKNLGMAGKWFAYGQSKLANVLYASELSRQYPDLTTSAIHPGLIDTGLTAHLGLLDRALIKAGTLGTPRLNVREGAYNTLWASTVDKSFLQSGCFYEPVGKLVLGTIYSEDESLARELWYWSERELAQYF